MEDVDLAPEELKFLQSLGGGESQTGQLAEYCSVNFQALDLPQSLRLPLEEEAHVAHWRKLAESVNGDALAQLRERFPQLYAPIRSGIADSEVYRRCVRRGELAWAQGFDSKLELREPKQVTLFVHDHVCGALPIISTPIAEDFKAIVRALYYRSEPAEVPASVNALLLAGLVNWKRINEYKLDFVQHNPAPSAWPDEMQRVMRAEPWRFTDKILLICDTNYSGVAAHELPATIQGIEWLQASRLLRLEHEFMHYATKRIYNRMHLNLLDETICDWIGMRRAIGHYDAELFLRFLGLHSSDDVDHNSRAYMYKDDLDPEAFSLLGALMQQVARNLGQIDRAYANSVDDFEFAFALTRLNLCQIAMPGCENYFQIALREVQKTSRRN